MLVDEEDGNVLAVLGVLLERGLDSGSLGLCKSATTNGYREVKWDGTIGARRPNRRPRSPIH